MTEHPNVSRVEHRRYGQHDTDEEHYLEWLTTLRHQGASRASENRRKKTRLLLFPRNNRRTDTMWPSTASFVSTRVRRTLLALTGVILMIQHAAADCQCGYSAAVGNTSADAQQGQETFVFTDLIEAFFPNISDISRNTDWVRQEWNTSAAQARGTYGQMFAVDNVATQEGADGLQITVRSDVVEGMLSGGEIDSARLDVSYGSFRSSLRLTDVAGTVC